MAIMAAGVHPARVFGRERERVLLRDGQSVNVASYCNLQAWSFASQMADQASGQGALIRDTPLVQQAGDRRRRIHLLETQFWMSMKLTPPSNNPVLDSIIDQ